ncbi:hypothetical protein HHX47_DHR1002087 [Lentinula edodes]|nr:hypothetical protein HHX47_DHR1002087 [Lentinula edodes]
MISCNIIMSPETFLERTWNKQYAQYSTRIQHVLYHKIRTPSLTNSLPLPRFNRSWSLSCNIPPTPLLVLLPDCETRDTHKVRDIIDHKNAKSRIGDEGDEKGGVDVESGEEGCGLNYRGSDNVNIKSKFASTAPTRLRTHNQSHTGNDVFVRWANIILPT